MLIAIIIPVFNEKGVLPELMARLDATPPPRDASGRPCERLIVLIDDASTDGTADLVRTLAQRPNVRACFHTRNQGKGAALRTGFRQAIAERADVLIVQDGDLEYSPKDHEPLARPILDGLADACIGTRYRAASRRVDTYWHRCGNSLITWLSNALSNLDLSDVECCLKAMRREVAEGVRIEENRFGVEPELVAKLARMRVIDAPHPAGSPSPSQARRLRIHEVPVSYHGRTYAEGKKITWRDGLSALRCIVKYNLWS